MALFLYDSRHVWIMVCLDAFLWLSQLFQNETADALFWVVRPFFADPVAIPSDPISGNHGIDVMPIGIFFGMLRGDCSNFEPEI